VSPAQRRGRGRPVTFDAHQRQRYLEAITAGAKLTDAAALVGITTRWARQVADTDSAFAAALTTARAAGQRVRAENMPHGETRYIKLGCRCDICTKDATANRTARRHRTRAETEEDSRPDTPNVLQLPSRHGQVGDAPPLARVS
jgi:hypothetical protein